MTVLVTMSGPIGRDCVDGCANECVDDLDDDDDNCVDDCVMRFVGVADTMR
jgi:hypothetical protein